MHDKRSRGPLLGYQLLGATVEIDGARTSDIRAVEACLGRAIASGPIRTSTFVVQLSDAADVPLDPLVDERAADVLSYLRRANLAHGLNAEWRWTSNARPQSGR